MFVFDVGSKTWKFYDWSQITTVVIFGEYDPELMCYAHSHGARVVLKGELQFLPDASSQLVSLPALCAILTFQKNSLFMFIWYIFYHPKINLR